MRPRLRVMAKSPGELNSASLTPPGVTTSIFLKPPTTYSELIVFRLARGLHVFGRFHVEARIVVDETQMVMHVLDAGRILGGDDRRPARVLVDNEAVKMHDAVSHRDLESDRSPVGRIDLSRDAVTDVIVICSR